MNRIKQLRNELGLSQGKFAQKIGVNSQQLMSSYERGETQPSMDLWIKMSELFDADIEYIAGESNIRRKQNVNFKNGKKLLPVLGTVKAGYNYLAEENIIDYIEPHMNISNSEDYFGLVVKGDSMAPLFDEGDYVVVHKQDDFESNKVCIVLINGDEATIKKVIKTNDGIELHCFNPYYPSRKYSFKEMQDLKIKIIGVVEQQIRNWK